MKAILLDMRRNLWAAAAIDGADTLQLSVVSYLEGIRGARNKRELQATKKALANLDFQILGLSENIGHRASIYLEEYAMKSNIGVPDALIAATALETKQRLYTANAKEYRAIAEIQPELFRP